MRKILFALPVMLAVACHQGEELPADTLPGLEPTNVDSMHRPMPTDTDSMIEPRTGKPKTQETDTI